MRFLLFLAPAFLIAQSNPPDSPGVFIDLAHSSARLQPVFRQIHPNEWTGAPASSQTLLENTAKANQALQTHAEALSKTPESLAESLKLLEEMRDVNESLLELAAAVRQYQNPAMADLIAGMLAEGKPARDVFSHRVLDLAAQREAQLDVADHEAQRCRAQISRQPKR